LSRPLVIFALACFAIAGLVPLATMCASVGADDLVAIFSERTLSLLGRTLLLGLSVSAISFLIGVPFGWLVARTDIPGHSWLRPLGLVPLLMPTLVLAMSWAPLTEMRGAPAAILFLGGSTFPLVALMSARAFERLDGRREEAARLAGGLRAVLRMELPLVLPAALVGTCLAFAFAINDFAVPDYVSSVGPKFNVYADEIFFNWHDFENPGAAIASALPLIALSMCALVPVLALRRKGAFATLDGNFVTPARLQLGRWRVPAFLFCFAIVGLTTLVPLGRLFWEASGGPRVWTDPSVAAELGQILSEEETVVVSLGDRLSVLPSLATQQWSNFQSAFSLALERSRSDLRNSLSWSFQAALACCIIGLILGHAIERARNRWLGRALEMTALLPLASPAILLGIGTIVVWNHGPTADFYESGGMSVVLFIGRFATFAILLLSGAVASLSPSLEESAALSGAGPLRRLTSIVAPSLRGSLVACFILVFVFSMRELDAALLVPAANKTAILRIFNGVHFGRADYVAALTLLLVFAILLPGLLWSIFARKRLEILP
jgi:iron(III) transport system permease protein